MKNTFFALLLMVSCTTFSQVGIGNLSPEAALDVQSNSSGILIPRVDLNSDTDVLTVTNPAGGSLVEGTLVYNTGSGSLTPAGFYYWNGSSWKQFFDDSPDIYVGKAIISAAGTLNITGLPFQPKSVTFTAYANVESYTLNSDNGTFNNDTSIANSYGYMKGYARQDPGSIDQQVIYGGGSGNSINDISRYASPLHCIGLRYSNQNGTAFGITSAILTSFNSDGFTLNVDSYIDSVVILFEARKY